MNIYVSNLNHLVTDESLKETFAPHGQVTSAKVIVDQFTGYSRGFGFVDMPNDAEAKPGSICKIPDTLGELGVLLLPGGLRPGIDFTSGVLITNEGDGHTVVADGKSLKVTRAAGFAVNFVEGSGKIIEGIGLKRDQVFIGNINRCRPPGNRAPSNPPVATMRGSSSAIRRRCS